jgi:hypothetical protein
MALQDLCVLTHNVSVFQSPYTLYAVYKMSCGAGRLTSPAFVLALSLVVEMGHQPIGVTLRLLHIKITVCQVKLH